jgi:hypothetical protein
MRYPSSTIQTSTEGHIVIATNARIESQIGVSVTDATASAGREAATAFGPATGLRRARAGGRRATLLAREIGTTLLFIRPPIATAMNQPEAFTKLRSNSTARRQYFDQVSTTGATAGRSIGAGIALNRLALLTGGRSGRACPRGARPPRESRQTLQSVRQQESRKKLRQAAQLESPQARLESPQAARPEPPRESQRDGCKRRCRAMAWSMRPAYLTLTAPLRAWALRRRRPLLPPRTASQPVP